jgi:hypothetical protein
VRPSTPFSSTCPWPSWGASPPEPSNLSFLPTEQYYGHLIWLAPLVLAAQWLLPSAFIHVVLRFTGRRVRELCRQYGISDRMPRPIIPGDKRALNKRIVEALANECYTMELENVPGQRVWAYRKAAWAIEDLEVGIGLLYRQMGRKGLESIENVGPRLAGVVEELIEAQLPERAAQHEL